MKLTEWPRLLTSLWTFTIASARLVATPNLASMRLPDRDGLGGRPGPGVCRHWRIALHLRRRALDVEQVFLARVGPVVEFGRQVLALVQLLRQIAPPNREVKHSPRGAALVAGAAMPDVAIDDRDGTGSAGQLDFPRMRGRRILGNDRLVLGPHFDPLASAMFTSGTLIGVHLCEPGTIRVGPFVEVMSSSITIELTTRQSVGETRGTSLCNSCCP